MVTCLLSPCTSIGPGRDWPRLPRRRELRISINRRTHRKNGKELEVVAQCYYTNYFRSSESRVRVAGPSRSSKSRVRISR